MNASIVKSAALVLALTMAAAACSSTADQGGASEHVLSAKYMRHHLTGMPPLGARPSTPQPIGRCLVNWMPNYAVYPDGVVIWQRWTGAGAPRVIPTGANPRTTAFVQQRLTPRGARLVRSQATATGAKRYHFRPDLLPAWAWADRTVRPYIPTHYEISHDHGGPGHPSRIPAAARTALAHLNWFEGRRTPWITLHQAITLAHTFLKAGMTPFFHLPGGWFEYHFPGGGTLNMGPLLPGANLRSKC